MGWSYSQPPTSCWSVKEHLVSSAAGKDAVTPSWKNSLWNIMDCRPFDSWWQGRATGMISAIRYVMICIDKIRQAINWFRSYWWGFSTLDFRFKDHLTWPSAKDRLCIIVNFLDMIWQWQKLQHFSSVYIIISICPLSLFPKFRWQGTSVSQSSFRQPRRQCTSHGSSGRWSRESFADLKVLAQSAGPGWSGLRLSKIDCENVGKQRKLKQQVHVCYMCYSTCATWSRCRICQNLSSVRFSFSKKNAIWQYRVGRRFLEIPLYHHDDW